MKERKFFHRSNYRATAGFIAFNGQRITLPSPLFPPHSSALYSFFPLSRREAFCTRVGRFVVGTNEFAFSRDLIGNIDRCLKS